MEIEPQGLTETLRRARHLKAWSQREFSIKAGLTQAHISRIESGAVDPKLSTLLELARLLDLELLLVPRTAITAVNAVIREAETSREARSVRGAAITLERLVRDLRAHHPKEPAVKRLGELVRDFQTLESLFQRPGSLAELNRVVEEIEAAARRPDQGLNALRRGVHQLADLRNQLVHARSDAEQPAYTLDDED
jgi:transcriptional regulator with XRE-family HTH domain